MAGRVIHRTKSGTWYYNSFGALVFSSKNGRRVIYSKKNKGWVAVSDNRPKERKLPVPRIVADKEYRVYLKDKMRMIAYHSRGVSKETKRKAIYALKSGKKDIMEGVLILMKGEKDNER